MHLDEWKAAIKAAADELDLSLAVLFGSQADGTARADSDIDLALWLGRFPHKRKLSSSRKLTAVRTLSRLLETDRVDPTFLNTSSPLIWVEASRGKCLYQRSPSLFAEFCSLTLRFHNDARALYEADQRFLESRLS